MCWVIALSNPFEKKKQKKKTKKKKKTRDMVRPYPKHMQNFKLSSSILGRVYLAKVPVYILESGK